MSRIVRPSDTKTPGIARRYRSTLPLKTQDVIRSQKPFTPSMKVADFG